MAGVRVIEVSLEGLTLTVAIDPRGQAPILEAGHRGTAPPALAAADRFCALIEGLPIQEAAEHGVLHLLAELRDPGEPPPVAGILTVQSSGDVFVLLQRLIRGVYAAYLSEAGEARQWNRWNPRMPSDWLRLGKERQASGLKPILADQLAIEGLTSDDMWISDIERGLRIVVSFGVAVPAWDKPSLLMRLERRLRNATGKRLEVYAEEMIDQNAIRRL